MKEINKYSPIKVSPCCSPVAVPSFVAKAHTHTHAHITPKTISIAHVN